MQKALSEKFPAVKLEKQSAGWQEKCWSVGSHRGLPGQISLAGGWSPVGTSPVAPAGSGALFCLGLPTAQTFGCLNLPLKSRERKSHVSPWKKLGCM